MSTKKGTVYVGLSGGVESSVAAVRLQNNGYDVVGVFIRVWQPDFLACNWEAERLDAMKVAAHLGIPFLTFDASEAYKREVGLYFIEEYKAGRTPNPDVMCNQYVKFGAFYDFARKNGADYVATGHYASVMKEDCIFSLQRGVDSNKDQTYFLWTLTQTHLEHILLPVGDSQKETIRKEAEAAKLPTAQKKDSQGVCFLGHIDIPEFLSHFVELNDGRVVDTFGHVIGTHQGALVYTLGQRHGFTVDTNSDNRTPYYVVNKNLETNTVVVDSSPPLVKEQTTIKLHSVNWIKGVPEKASVEAQFRYRQTPFEINLMRVTDEACTIELLSPVEKPAVGQSCVFYDGDECLGGGIIAE